MRIHRTVRTGAATLSLALVLAACGDTTDTSTPSDEGSSSDASSPTDASGEPSEPMAEASALACQVTDTGGVDDKSFNETAFAGLERSRDELGAEIAVLESQATTDFEPNINAFLEQGCDIIVTVGFLLGDATLAAAQANPDVNFAIVDVDFFDFDAGADITLDNAAELTFATDQAAFLAGYLAAGQTTTGILGTFGGINIPPVTIFMNGFEAGMNHYNTTKGTSVKLLGWSSEAQDGLFTGDFEDQDKGRATAESLLDEGADIIMPVAGPVGLGAAAAVKAAGDATIVWVDSDGCVSTDFCDIMSTSVMKNMDVAVFDSVKSQLDGNFAAGLYLGTLANGGVGLAPFHDAQAPVDATLQAEVEALATAIISGELSVS
ncbi:MAG: basic membrane protein A [Glaciecola sp.]|jgi:basic membrane protein A